MKEYLLLDFGGTFLKYAWIDEDYRITEQGRTEAPLESEEHFCRAVADLASRRQISGIAISMPGILDTDTGYALKAGSYRHLAGKNIYKLLAAYTDLPVTVENDGKAAALAELKMGALQGVNTGAAIIIGTGLGGGVIMDGRLRKGSHYASGEFTGFLMKPGSYNMDSSAAMNAGMTGFLLDVARTKHMDPADFEVSANFVDHESDRDTKISGKDVFSWIENNDPETMEAYQRWLESLVFIMINLKAVLDPEKIVIGGGVSANQRFIEDLNREFCRAGEAMSVWKRFDMKIEQCRFRADANLIGALCVFREKYN
ncbi:MAG: ROK family protein [Solobacterium sp.]|nr:ROK family protein [Solobacterium sp.]